jgi:hypothetical protein
LLHQEVAPVDELSRWVLAQNIVRFRIMLANETDPGQRATIERLLKDYQARLAEAEPEEAPDDPVPPRPQCNR